MWWNIHSSSPTLYPRLGERMRGVRERTLQRELATQGEIALRVAYRLRARTVAQSVRIINVLVQGTKDKKKDTILTWVYLGEILFWN